MDPYSGYSSPGEKLMRAIEEDNVAAIVRFVKQTLYPQTLIYCISIFLQPF